MIKTTSLFVAAASMLVLSACTNQPDAAQDTSAADEFAARINQRAANARPAEEPVVESEAPPAAPFVEPRVAPEQPNAAAGPFQAGTATDPDSVTCGANQMGQFFGQLADTQTQLAIQATAGPGREVRYVRPEENNFRADVTHPRLNIMLDNMDIIRDARCG